MKTLLATSVAEAAHPNLVIVAKVLVTVSCTAFIGVLTWSFILWRRGGYRETHPEMSFYRSVSNRTGCLVPLAILTCLILAGVIGAIGLG